MPVLQRLRPLVARIIDEVHRELGGRTSEATLGRPLAPSYAPPAGRHAVDVATRLWDGRNRR